MLRPRLSRRDLFEKCLASGALIAASPALAVRAFAAHEEARAAADRRPTPHNELGPFYRRNAPANGALAPAGEPGLPLEVQGLVLDTRGEALPGALVEVWHADPKGVYDLDGYRFRASLPAREKGGYSFRSVMPGHYPDRVAQHVHFRVSAPSHKTVVTQLYFATDPAFEGDPDRTYKKDPVLKSRELIRPVTVSEVPGAFLARVAFDVCLEPA
jgi:protocatechuate 3,4-dioxygenase beta subunit